MDRSRAGAGGNARVAKSARLAALRRRIAALEGGETRTVEAARARFAPASPSAANDDDLDRVRVMAGLHDLRPARYLDAPAAYAFAAFWLAGLPDDRTIVWVRAAGDPRLDFGAPCPDGLKRRGIDPARILHVRARPGAEALWAMETALSAGAIVLGEAGRDPAYDLTASRRLHRAARAAGVAALVLRAHDADGPSAALTRWTIRPALSTPAAWAGAGGLAGLGPVRMRADLERQRGGPPRSFELEWSEDALRRPEPAPLADRPADRAGRRAG